MTTRDCKSIEVRPRPRTRAHWSGHSCCESLRDLIADAVGDTMPYAEFDRACTAIENRMADLEAEVHEQRIAIAAYREIMRDQAETIRLERHEKRQVAA